MNYATKIESDSPVSKKVQTDERAYWDSLQNETDSRCEDERNDPGKADGNVWVHMSGVDDDLGALYPMEHSRTKSDSGYLSSDERLNENEYRNLEESDIQMENSFQVSSLMDTEISFNRDNVNDESRISAWTETKTESCNMTAVTNSYQSEHIERGQLGEHMHKTSSVQPLTSTPKKCTIRRVEETRTRDVENSKSEYAEPLPCCQFQAEIDRALEEATGGPETVGLQPDDCTVTLSYQCDNIPCVTYGNTETKSLCNVSDYNEKGKKVRLTEKTTKMNVPSVGDFTFSAKGDICVNVYNSEYVQVGNHNKIVKEVSMEKGDSEVKEVGNEMNLRPRLVVSHRKPPEGHFIKNGRSRCHLLDNKTDAHIELTVLQDIRSHKPFEYDFKPPGIQVPEYVVRANVHREVMNGSSDDNEGKNAEDFYMIEQTAPHDRETCLFLLRLFGPKAKFHITFSLVKKQPVVCKYAYMATQTASNWEQEPNWETLTEVTTTLENDGKTKRRSKHGPSQRNDPPNTNRLEVGNNNSRKSGDLVTDSSPSVKSLYPDKSRTPSNSNSFRRVVQNSGSDLRTDSPWCSSLPVDGALSLPIQPDDLGAVPLRGSANDKTLPSGSINDKNISSYKEKFKRTEPASSLRKKIPRDKKASYKSRLKDRRQESDTDSEEEKLVQKEALLKRTGQLNTKKYALTMKKLTALQDDGDWEAFDKLSTDLRHCFNWQKKDLKCVVVIEQGVKAYYQNDLDNSRKYLCEAVELSDKTDNPNLLKGRALFILGNVYREEKKLGLAEESLKQSEQLLCMVESEEDQAELNYNLGNLMMEFLNTAARPSRNLVLQAKKYFQKELEIASQCLDEKVRAKKMRYALLKIAMLLLDCRNELGRKRQVNKEDVEEAKTCLDRIENELWDYIAYATKIQFYLARSDQFYRMKKYKRSSELAEEALQMIEERGFNTQIKKAEERIAHVQQFLPRDCISEISNEELLRQLYEMTDNNHSHSADVDSERHEEESPLNVTNPDCL